MQVSVSNTSTWSDGTSNFAKYEVMLTNTGTTSITNATIRIQRCDKVTQIWTVEPDVGNGTYRLPKWAVDNGGLAHRGGTFSFGFIAVGSTPEVTATSMAGAATTSATPPPPAVPTTTATSGFEQTSIAYLQEYPDVKSSGLDAWDHYVRYGVREGRKWRGDHKPISSSSTPSLSPSLSPSSPSSGQYTAKSNGKIYYNDLEIKINGINWFGLNTSTHTVHSLWLTPIDEYIAILKRGKFNAVRLTLSAHHMLNLDSLKVDGVNESVNPGMSHMSAGQHLDDLIDRLAREGILVMLNMHRMTGLGDNAEDIGPLWYSDAYPQDRIVEAWVSIAK